MNLSYKYSKTVLMALIVIWIPTLPYPWDEVVFKATDAGPSINGKHVDVFTGQGIEAQQMTEEITSFGNKICLERK